MNSSLCDEGEEEEANVTDADEGIFCMEKEL